MRIAEMFTWIVFRAHPSGFVPEEDFHPDFFGTFVCPASRSRPEELLKEVLDNQKLALIEIGSTQLKSKADEWGMNERLKRPLDEQGFGISLVKVQPSSGQTD
jgi:hypothetical protein